MNIDRLKSQLGSRALRFYEKTGSTNTDAITWLKEEPQISSGAVVVADEQESGRGRFSRKWMTPPSSAIAMSVIIKDEMTSQQLAMATGLSVIDALKPLVKNNISLKWPNDILLDNKKVGGCLIETVCNSKGVKVAIIGIGINISVDFHNTNLNEKATSLSFHSQQLIDRVDIISKILDRIDFWRYSDNIFESWKSHLSTIGKKVQVVTLNDILEGLVIDVKKDGALLLKTASGDLKKLFAGDVSITY